MSDLHVVTGAGPVGTTIAEQLAATGVTVRILTRSGSGPDHPLIERRAVDVNDRHQLAAAVDGAAAVYHCITRRATPHGPGGQSCPAPNRRSWTSPGARGRSWCFRRACTPTARSTGR